MTEQGLAFIRNENIVIIRNLEEYKKFCDFTDQCLPLSSFKMTIAGLKGYFWHCQMAELNDKNGVFDGKTLYAEMQAGYPVGIYAYPHDHSIEDWYGVEAPIEVDELIG